MAKISKTFQYGKHQVTLETGEIARQAGGAVLVKVDGTEVLVSAVAAKSAREGQDFFPLTVDYQEKFYAGGRIPGGFFKREGRPTEKETLISRLIDRPIRPLFPEDYKNEVQIIATLVSLNPEVEGDIPRCSAPPPRWRCAAPRSRARSAPRRSATRTANTCSTRRQRAQGFRNAAGRRRHLERGADGRIRGQGGVRGRDARRGDVRPQAHADRDQRDQRTGHRGRHQAVHLDRAGEERGHDRRAEGSGGRPGSPAPSRCATSCSAATRSRRSRRT